LSLTRSFNPRPCARGDKLRSRQLRPHKRFNPRPCARGDQVQNYLIASIHDVSIHAPARGATACRWKSCFPGTCFNPRPCARGDPRCKTVQRIQLEFQSTPLREGRPRYVAQHPETFFVSIHAPARGATMPDRPYIAGQRVSIHAPARGATSSLCVRRRF